MQIIFTTKADPSLVLSYAFSGCHDHVFHQACDDFDAFLNQCDSISGTTLSEAFEHSSFLKDPTCMGLHWGRNEWRTWMRNLEKYIDFNHYAEADHACNRLYVAIYNCLKESPYTNAFAEFRAGLAQSLVNNGLSYVKQHLPEVLECNDENSVGYIAYTQYSGYQVLLGIMEHCAAPEARLQSFVLHHLSQEWNFFSTWEAWLKENKKRNWLDVCSGDGILMAWWMEKLLPELPSRDQHKIIDLALAYNIQLDHPLALDRVLGLADSHPVKTYYVEHLGAELEQHQAALSIGLTWEDIVHSKKYHYSEQDIDLVDVCVSMK